MKTEAHAQAFTNNLAVALLDFKAAVERRDKAGAHLQYAFACGLIGGAALSGGISKKAGQKLLVTLEETRSVLMAAFGEAPTVSAPWLN
ncbi:hypothetical protein K5D56_21790 [Pseudomonas cichorii]|nr:hypothetical protein [Pseudomonas cichorii]MBX8557102.1 hypothetical protein [Pseudomonas cichorii]MBX8592002.1 hypothetical protein [Pseudomonas cichorii]